MILFTEIDRFLTEQGVYDRMALNRSALKEYLRRIETTYSDLPYHNIHHIHKVVLCCIDIWCSMGLGDIVKRVNPTDHDILALSLVVAAAVHDCGHVGLTNDFLIRSHHRYAIDFNDISPNESHHTATAFRIMLDGCNFLRDASSEIFWLYRQQVIGLVSSTDMSKHHAILTSLRSRDFSQLGRTELTVLLQAALKCADVGHTFCEQEDHVTWSCRLQEEMLLEGEQWKQLGWQPPSSMDRSKGEDNAGSQLAFFRYIVIPFVEALLPALPAVQRWLDAAKANANYWRVRSDDGPKNFA